MELELDTLLTTSSWRMQRTIDLLELLEKVYDHNRLTVGGTHDDGNSIRRTAVPGRVRRASVRGAGVQRPRQRQGRPARLWGSLTQNWSQPPGNAADGTPSSAKDRPTPDAWGDGGAPAEASTLNWNTAFRQGARPRLLLAAAGMGKTFSSRWAAAQQAHEMAAALRSGDLPLDEARIPIWLEASKLATLAGATLSDRLQRWATTFLDEHGVTDPETQELLLRRLRPGGGDTWTLFIDSLDEMRHSEVIRFRQLMGTGGTAGHGLVLTSRPGVDFGSVLPPGFPSYDVLELLPFDETEQAEFLHRYEEALGEPPEKPSRAQPVRAWLTPLRAALETDPALRALAATPLLLRFMCDLAEHGNVVSGLSEADLYRSMIDSLLDGRWRVPVPATDAPRPSAAISSQQLRLRTRCLSGELFLRFPEARAFSYEDWMRAYSAAAAQEPRLFADCQPQATLTEWEQVGLVRVAGDEWVYGHKTFMDYLAAEYLAGLAKQRRRELIAPVLGFVSGEIYGCHPGWEQTLDFLAAQRGPHAAELVRLVEAVSERDGDDFARPLLALQIRWAVRAGSPLPGETRRRLAEAVVRAGIGAGSSLLNGKPKPLYAWARQIYQDIARDEVMTATATRQLEKEKSTYGLSLLGTPEARAAIQRCLTRLWSWESKTAALLRRWKIKGWLAWAATELSSVYARLWCLHPEDAGLDRSKQSFPALADLARAGDDRALARWARRLLRRINAQADKDGQLSYDLKKQKERLGTLLLLCGGPASGDLLFKEWTPGSDLLAWDNATLSETLQGPHAAAFKRRLFDLVVTGNFDARVLTRINFPGLDHELAEYWDDPRRFLDARLLDTEMTPLSRKRLAGRLLLLRHASQAQPVAFQILNEEDTLDVFTRGIDPRHYQREFHLALAIRTAEACGMSQVKSRVVALADRLENYQVTFRATQYLREHGDAADLARIRAWLETPAIYDNPNNSYWQSSFQADRTECARLALLHEAVGAHLKLAPDQGAEFVRAALDQMWAQSEGWHTLRIQDLLEALYIPNYSGYGWNDNPLDQLLTLVAAEAPEQAVALIDQVVLPRLAALKRRYLKDVLSFWRWRELMSRNAPWMPGYTAVTKLRQRARILRALASGDLDQPKVLDHTRALLVERGGAHCFEHLCGEASDDEGVVPFKQSTLAEQVFTMAARLKLRASRHRAPNPFEDMGTPSWAETRPWPDTKEIKNIVFTLSWVILLLTGIVMAWTALNSDEWCRRVQAEFADRAWDSSAASGFSLMAAGHGLYTLWPRFAATLGRWQDAMGIAFLAVVPLTVWRYGVHTLLRGAQPLPARRKLAWSLSGLTLLWVPVLAALALLAETGTPGVPRLRVQALGDVFLWCLLTSDVQRCLRMWVTRHWREHATAGLCLGWALLACAAVVPAVVLLHTHPAVAMLSAAAVPVFISRFCEHASDLYGFWLEHRVEEQPLRCHAYALALLAALVFAAWPLNRVIFRLGMLLPGGWHWLSAGFSGWVTLVCLAGVLSLAGVFILNQLHRITGDVTRALAGRTPTLLGDDGNAG